MAILPIAPTAPVPVVVPVQLERAAEVVQTAPASASVLATLSIPLDVVDVDGKGPAIRKKRTKPVIQRDSLKRREALLRGKEGSRRRQRWENSNLFNNPYREPPTKDDWEPHPMHVKKHVPYQYASLWDHPNFPKRKETPKAIDDEKVPRALKVRFKKTQGAMGLLRTLEEDVRDFMANGNMTSSLVEVDNASSDDDDVVSVASEEEVVYISKRERKLELKENEKVLYESLAEDSSASFGRWLVHSIATYYGLRSWSITCGNPAKRIAIVGMKNAGDSSGKQLIHIPRPLYTLL